MLLPRDIKRVEANLSKLEEAIRLLEEAGVLYVLRQEAVPIIYDGGADINKQATESARCFGFHQALDTLIHFREIYLDPKQKGVRPNMTFGGEELAFKQGLITKEERDVLAAKRKGN